MSNEFPSISQPNNSSPSFNLKNAKVDDIENALDQTGHVVLDNVWSLDYLSELFELTEKRFKEDDSKFKNGFFGFPNGQVDSYLGGFSNMEALHVGVSNEEIHATAKAHDLKFFLEINKSNLPVLYSHLLKGDFIVSRSERVIRRVTPQFPLRFAGMHCDGQLGQLSGRAYRSSRELTLWSPLVSCATDERPRLLLLRRGQILKDVFQKVDYIKTSDVSYVPVFLRPDAIRDEAQFSHLIPLIQEQFEKIYSTKICYSPRVPLGSSILFDSDIWHGSYMNKTMKSVRYSLDFRVVGEYALDEVSSKHTGCIFRSKDKVSFAVEEYPPYSPEIEEGSDLSLKVKVINIYNKIMKRL